MSNKDSNTISTSTETVRANTVDKEKPSPHMESENPAPTPENNEQNKTNASQITSNQTDENRNQKLKKTVVILGDSMVKHINGWGMAKKVNTDCKVFVKSFSGATTQCMVDDMKPSIRTQPDHFILHVGTNDLTSNTPSDEIARNIISLASCYKNPDKPTCIDLILTNVPRSFQSTCVVETGLSDFHLMTLTVMRKSFKKFQPKIINYRSYKTFSNEAYRETLINNLSKENFIINDKGFKRFCEISLDSLEKHAPSKKKYARGNQMPFFNKELSKAIITRTKLRNIFLQNKSEENRIRYARQRNFCVSLLRKTKKEYYQNLNEKSVIDNKSFWKTVKPFLSDKTHGNDKIHLIENDELLKTDLETAEVFNEFFSNT